MVNAIPELNLPVLNFAYHLPKLLTDRFANVNGKQPVYFFAGGNLLCNKTKGGKISAREKSSEVDLTNQLPLRH